MYNLKSLIKVSENQFEVLDELENPHTIEEEYPIEDWDCELAFKVSGIRGYEPMTAKELDTVEKQDSVLSDSNYIIEEKFDGTRALVYFLEEGCRVFSRRISKKTGFYVENSDSLPHIKQKCWKEDMSGTILDGEMFIDGLPFKEVSSTLNCLWNKAIDRQMEKGFISFHAFDILFYHGIDLRKLPLIRRKTYLHLAIEEANNGYIKEVPYFNCGDLIDTRSLVSVHGNPIDVYMDLNEKNKLGSYPSFADTCLPHKTDQYSLSPRAFYEYIIATGGEGVMVKPKDGKYLHKRGWEYSKIKKFFTRDLIIIGFEEPTREYTGKDIKKWGFWERNSDGKKLQGNFYGDKNYTPITRHYYYNQVGTMKLGVLVSEEELEKIPKNKRGQLYQAVCVKIYNHDEYYAMQVCECSGYDDEMREYLTRNQSNLVGEVAEIKCNEVFKDSGNMRHPRFIRLRSDKEALRCTWKDHINA